MREYFWAGYGGRQPHKQHTPDRAPGIVSCTYLAVQSVLSVDHVPAALGVDLGADNIRAAVVEVVFDVPKYPALDSRRVHLVLVYNPVRNAVVAVVAEHDLGASPRP